MNVQVNFLFRGDLSPFLERKQTTRFVFIKSDIMLKHGQFLNLDIQAHFIQYTMH